ncbi:hypothetical protein SteCoe_3045 [Stentor coeruleus]|uniref:CH-like domain-containing protein n=1 Tax=Stentor coeruleus TaxID=5963 RepID=A0A1R2CXW2_9CILI|nr:hypothetical protein SteCoe_3045 [Stentor coeruleus]
MEVTPDIANWLKEAKIIEKELNAQENGKFLIPDNLAMPLENGLNFTPLIKRLYQILNKLDREMTPMPELNSLKEVKSPAAKLYNWKVLTKALELLGIQIDPDSRSLIIAGDRDMVVEVLEKMYQAEKKAQVDSDDENYDKDSFVSKVFSDAFPKSVSSKKSTSISRSKKPVEKPLPKSKKRPDGSLYIEAVRADKPLETTDNCLEYLLVSFCKHFSLHPKQAAGLLTQGGKYLSYVISKGLKGKHGPIISWYTELYSTLPHLIRLISNEQASGSLSLMLGSLKSGFNSKNLEVVLWCCRLFSKLGSDFYEIDLLPPAWDWFVSEGLESTLQACKHFAGDVKPQIVSVLAQFARNNFIELFTIQMPASLSESINYITTVDELLPNFCEIRSAKQEIISGGIVEFWVDLGLKEADDFKEPGTRLAAMNFMINVWMLFPSVIENHEYLANEIIATLKKGWRDKLNILKFACIGKAFQLLEVFSGERNPFAPIIYKTLTFYLVENYRDSLIREFILQNFKTLFESAQSIPIGILLEPLIKQFQITQDLECNTIDFEFFISISKHPRLTLKHAVQAMDILGKIYMSQRAFIKSAAMPFMTIAQRFIDGSSVKEYLYRFVKYSLKLSLKFETQKIRNSSMAGEKPQKLQRELMLDLTQKVIKLRNEALNERVVKEICDVYFQIKKLTGGSSKAMLVLLNLLGDPRELLEMHSMDSVEPQSNNDDDMSQADEGDSKKVVSKIIPLRTKKLSTQTSTTSLNSMNLIPKGRAQREIERIRQNKLEKELELKLKEEQTKQNLENKKKTLRKQLEQRKIELGVPRKDNEGKIEEPKIETQVLFDISPEEKEVIGFVLKRYQRVLKLLFKKYSSTGYKHSVVNQATFDSLAEKNTTLSDSEYYRLLKEQGVTTSMITLEEFSSLMKTYCHKQKKPSIKVNFTEFQELIVQTALSIFAKPSKDFSHHPVIAVKSLFEYFRKSSSEKGVLTKFYDEPDPGVGDREIVKRLNLLLEKDPNTELPEGYKKIVENEVDVVYCVPEFMKVGESYEISLGILDDLLTKIHGIHVLEPMIKIRQITRARGVLIKPQIAPEQDISEELGSKFNISSIGITYHKATYQPAPPSELNLTPGIKFEIARLTGKYSNDHLMDVAKIMDDLIYSVDSGSLTIVSRNSKVKTLNKAQAAKEYNLSLKKVEEETKEKKRKLRSQIIEEKLLKAKAKKETIKKEEDEKKQAEIARKKDLQRRNEEKRKEQNEKIEKELKEWKEKKREEAVKAKNDEKAKKAAQDEEKKHRLEEFKERERIKQQEIQEKLEISLKEQKAADPIKAKKDTDKQKYLEKVFKLDKAQQEEKKKNTEKIKNLMISPQIMELFASYSKSLDLVFNHFVKSTSKDPSSSTTMVFLGFNKFCTMFNICPGIMQLEDCSKIFKLITKTKPSNAGGVIGLEIYDFKEACLRISIITKAELDAYFKMNFTEEILGLKAFFDYLNLTPDIRQTRDLLQTLEINNNKAHPRDKRQKRLIINSSDSRDRTPNPRIRSSSSPKKKQELNNSHV